MSSYLLATTESVARWYAFNTAATVRPIHFALIDHLDLNAMPLIGNKQSAKAAAQELGLKTWRYVRL